MEMMPQILVSAQYELILTRLTCSTSQFPGVYEKEDSTISVVADNRMKTGMTFEDIVRGNQSPKSVLRVNPVTPSQRKHVPQKKQVARFTIAWWKMHLDIFATYHTVFVTW